MPDDQRGDLAEVLARSRSGPRCPGWVVPRIAVVTGRCFAGNAVIAGTSDLIVALSIRRRD